MQSIAVVPELRLRQGEENHLLAVEPTAPGRIEHETLRVQEDEHA